MEFPYHSVIRPFLFVILSIAKNDTMKRKERMTFFFVSVSCILAGNELVLQKFQLL